MKNQVSPTKASSLLPLPATTYTPPSANRSKASALEQNVARVPKMARHDHGVHEITCERLEALQQGGPLLVARANGIARDGSPDLASAASDT